MKQKNDHIFCTISDNSDITPEVNAGWATFSINIVPNLEVGGDACLGCVDFDKFHINLEKKMEDGVAKETLLHEICHIFLDLCGLGDSIEGSPEKFDVTNEALAVTMTRAMLLFTNLNPKLAKELLNLNE